MSDPPATVADRLAAELETDGALVAHGSFDIDAVAGLDKLGRYQLADPTHYILRLVEAGVRLGAEQIGFWIGRDGLVVRYLTPSEPITLPLDLHRRLLWVLVGEVDGLEQLEREAIVQLAIGVNAARARGYAQVWVDSVGADRRGFRLAFDTGDPSFVPIEDGDPGLSVHTRGRRGVVRPTLESRAEIALLRARVRWAQTAIYLDDVCISGHRFMGGTPVVDEGGAKIGESTIDRDPPSPACVVLLAAGVEIERIYPDARKGFLAVVEAALPRDLSRTEFIRGPEFDALIARVLDHQSGTAVTPSMKVESNDMGILFVPLTATGRKRARVMGRFTLFAAVIAIVFGALGVPDVLFGASFVTAAVSLWVTLFLWMTGPRDKNLRTHWRPPLRAPARPVVATVATDALLPGTDDDMKQLR